MMDRRGISLVEFLVALGIVVILFAFALSGVLRLRGSALRTGCQSNLRQLGLALNQHAETNKTFPSGVDQGYSLHVRLLPYIERADLAATYNLRFRDQLGQAVASIPVFRCPADPAALTEPVTNYRGCSSSVNWNTAVGDGLFGLRPLKPSDVANGLSQTLALAEALVGDHVSEPTPYRLQTVFAKARRTFDFPQDSDAFEEHCRSRLDASAVMANGWPWNHGSLGLTLYNHAATPNRLSCRLPTWGGQFTATSLHGDGVYGASADASVQFFSSAIDLAVWRSWATIADGTPPG